LFGSPYCSNHPFRFIGGIKGKQSHRVAIEKPEESRPDLADVVFREAVMLACQPVLFIHRW
tara:strand:- start:249 stop:431 length:183 start_codon:yes stop_codon:yes gene_type:complete